MALSRQQPAEAATLPSDTLLSHDESQHAQLLLQVASSHPTALLKSTWQSDPLRCNIPPHGPTLRLLDVFSGSSDSSSREARWRETAALSLSIQRRQSPGSPGRYPDPSISLANHSADGGRWSSRTPPPLVRLRGDFLLRRLPAAAPAGGSRPLADTCRGSPGRGRPGQAAPPAPLSRLLARHLLTAKEMRAASVKPTEPSRPYDQESWPPPPPPFLTSPSLNSASLSQSTFGSTSERVSGRQIIAWVCGPGRADPAAACRVTLAVLSRGAALAARLGGECAAAARLMDENRRLADTLFAAIAEGGRARCTRLAGGREGGGSDDERAGTGAARRPNGSNVEWFAGARSGGGGGEDGEGLAAVRAFEAAAADEATVFTWADGAGPRHGPAAADGIESPWRRGGLLMDGLRGLRAGRLGAGPARLIAGHPASCELVLRVDASELDGGDSEGGGGGGGGEETAPEAARLAWRVLRQGGWVAVPWPVLQRRCRAVVCDSSIRCGDCGLGGVGGSRGQGGDNQAAPVEPASAPGGADDDSDIAEADHSAAADSESEKARPQLPPPSPAGASAGGSIYPTACASGAAPPDAEPFERRPPSS